MNASRHLLLQSSSLVSRTAVLPTDILVRIYVKVDRDMMNEVTMIICTSWKSDYNTVGISLGV